MLTPTNAREIAVILKNAVPQFVFGIDENEIRIVFGVFDANGFKAKVGYVTHDGSKFVIDSVDNEYCHRCRTRQEVIEFLRELYARKGDWVF